MSFEEFPQFSMAKDPIYMCAENGFYQQFSICAIHTLANRGLSQS